MNEFFIAIIIILEQLRSINNDTIFLIDRYLRLRIIITDLISKIIRVFRDLPLLYKLWLFSF